MKKLHLILNKKINLVVPCEHKAQGENKNG